MKKYEFSFKDPKRFDAFCAALPDFKQCFEQAASLQWEGGEHDHISVFGEDCAWRINIPRTDIIAIAAYSPECWNRFDEVDPPINELMRIEAYSPDAPDKRVRCAAWFDGAFWASGALGGEHFHLDTDNLVIRFRPFIGPHEEP